MLSCGNSQETLSALSPVPTPSMVHLSNALIQYPQMMIMTLNERCVKSSMDVSISVWDPLGAIPLGLSAG